MDSINLKLVVWRQKDSDDKGHFEEYKLSDISTHMSFLEMFDVLNEKLISENLDPIVNQLFGLLPRHTKPIQGQKGRIKTN